MRRASAPDLKDGVALPDDYSERVYAGVLGKLIGVYLGRPIEGWSYERIAAEFGDVSYYVHERCGVPLVVPDDDITGTFTFLRALSDNGNDVAVSAQHIGESWLNYVVEGRTAFWWGGMGVSTEHTAFLRLKSGTPAPQSGSATLNGRTVAEQIGAQIFIDGWGMVAAGRPALAADLARRAASVSHDGEAVHAAVVIAAMVAEAFVEDNIDELLDVGVAQIPATSLIAELITALRGWRQTEPDWRRAREMLEARFGYDRYPGACHVVPNHGVVMLALLYGEGNFERSLMIANTSGWDTDCNSGNVGALLGIRSGLAGLDGEHDWRGPVADRMFLPGADGSAGVSDAVTEADKIVAIGRALASGVTVPSGSRPRFTFAMPESVQGFRLRRGSGSIQNVAAGPSGRSLRIACGVAGAVEVGSDVFIPPEFITASNYELQACPLLYPNQVLRAVARADSTNREAISGALAIQHYDSRDSLVTVTGPTARLQPGEQAELEWRIPDLGGQPVAVVGILVTSEGHPGALALHALGWDGEPMTTLCRPPDGGRMWARAWINAVDQFDTDSPHAIRVVQNRGRGLLIQGTREWRDYRVAATLYSDLADSIGLAIRVQGLRRFYAVLLRRGGVAQLVRVLDGDEVLAERSLERWSLEDGPHDLEVEGSGEQLQAWLDGELLFDVRDANPHLRSGAAGVVCECGTLSLDTVRISPAAVPSSVS
jgi:ADP-ribosylglycohydrolase